MARARPARSGRMATGAPGVLLFRNRLLTICRGFEINSRGDLTNVGVPLYRDIPASVAEESHETTDRASPVRRTIRIVTCKVDAWVDVQDDDTLIDQLTGYAYMIESMAEEPGIGYYPPRKVLTLKMRSGVTVKSD
jgi:hypothetical protein